MKITRSLLPLLLLFSASPASAMVLHVLVTEVRDGKSVVVMNGNRKLTVILEGVDAPELMQEYGDVARQHLTSLILGKEVDVHFTELQSANVVGKVVWNNMDVGLQVIRDGVAWYDKSNDHDLSEVERRVYAEAEQAARDEQRGLWHDGSPMPPWEWRRAQLARNVIPATHNSKRSGGHSLTTEDLLFTRKAAIANTPSNAKGRSALAKPSAKPLNRTGEDYDFRAYLTQGRTSIVYFYADWCPTCRQMGPVMDAINAQVPDMQVLFMDIGDWNTPVTQQYGITFVPYLKIYDKSGSLIVEGNAARSWLQQAIRQRM
ncbi:MAG TPA: thermonuclease family protein [Pyrinomonadaceae bacterium]|nr:thermonuclease family protein [Pyrinomonadaceae bacterium]